MSYRWIRFVASLLLAFVGCGEAAAPEAVESAPSADAMCAEHGVLEALCTQCNPALAAVFRARGDYCEEHGLPESICPVCHPERGGRPAVPVVMDEAPADGTRVRLATAELAERIGVRVEPVVPAVGAIEVPVTGHVLYDATRVARMNARSSGVVRAVHADVGTRVNAGDPLVTIASAEVAADRARIGAARTRLEVAEANLARRESLGDIVAARDVMSTREARDAAAAELAALRASVRIVGAGGRGAEYVLTAPFAGVVTERSVAVGSFVDGEETLVVVVDASRVWLEIDIPEVELARVREGMSVRAEIDGIALAIEGELTYVAPEIDPRTRTAAGRVSVENPTGALRANMFASAFVLVPRSEDGWLVPREALQHVRGADLVFVRIGGELYEARRVEVLEARPDRSTVEVRGRLAADENVVVDGAFLLRTETLRGSIGAGCCEGEEAGH